MVNYNVIVTNNYRWIQTLKKFYPQTVEVSYFPNVFGSEFDLYLISIITLSIFKGQSLICKQTIDSVTSLSTVL